MAKSIQIIIIRIKVENKNNNYNNNQEIVEQEIRTSKWIVSAEEVVKDLVRIVAERVALGPVVGVDWNAIFEALFAKLIVNCF